MHRALSILVSMISLAALAASPVVAAPAPFPPGPAATPEEAVRRFHEADLKGDATAYAFHAIWPVRQLWSQGLAMLEAEAGFKEALRRKFSKADARRTPAGPPRALLPQQGVLGYEVRARQDVVKGKEVHFTVWTRRDDRRAKEALAPVQEDVYTAVKEGAAWKVVAPLPLATQSYCVEERRDNNGGWVKVAAHVGIVRAPSAAELARNRRWVAGRRSLFQELSRAVVAGKFQSRADALRICKERLETLMEDLYAPSAGQEEPN